MEGNINNHKDCWVYPGAWDRPDHWNDPNANPNTGNNDYPGGSSGGGSDGSGGGGGAGNSGNPQTPAITKQPCVNSGTQRSNPLGIMKFAPPSALKPKGATFGLTRTDNAGNGKTHDGIDLAGNVGDPVFAARSGQVGLVVSTQPNRVKVGESYVYPESYSGDKNNAGNRIYIQNADKTEDTYWHLQAGNAIAINPRTGQKFKPGDVVQMGDIIGYIGQSGNAISTGVVHLHFGVRYNGKWQNPFNTLNATFNQSGNTFSISTPCN